MGFLNAVAGFGKDILGGLIGGASSFGSSLLGGVSDALFGGLKAKRQWKYQKKQMALQQQYNLETMAQEQAYNEKNMATQLYRIVLAASGVDIDYKKEITL